MEASHAAFSQYYHFVPRFILKNFAHPYMPQKAGSPNSINRPNGELGKKMYRGDPVVNCLNLSSETPEIIETPVKRVLGQTDMYRDTTKPDAEQYLIEEKLSRLESEASAIFRKITKSFDERHRGLWLTRNERNLIRKFILLMKYRGSTFYQRFYHETTTGYDANDRDRLLEYMREKGFERPIDVWLDNIKTIIDLKMDDELKWVSELPKRMYPDDAMWVILNCLSMYMAICTPSNPKDEFILTDNSYHVFEGPGRIGIDVNTGKTQEIVWTNFHEFSPVSPKLMIVLRSFLLPSPLEDANPKVKAHRDMCRSLAVENNFESGTNSVLADLPIEKARNNYTEILNGGCQFIPHEDGSLRQNHKFFFSFFPIDTNHVNKINGIFLDNASASNNVIGKHVTSASGDPRLCCLKKLAAVLKQMGSNKDPVWEEIPFPELDNDEKNPLTVNELRQLLVQLLPDDNPTEFMKVYKTLGGSKLTLVKDMEQAQLMLKLRINIDVWSRGIDERLRQTNRDVLLDTYLQFPPHGVWLYLKH
ncbi:Uncharacterized protein BP5553_08384 [Venustampulla echinocandica]|uniref:Uncharacterized protein n=1 Tax=Venustampulla echinocandica TaxID=2656787 RepID=A0A370TE29_9HELO|nr:Uncharacterized protein BP5553_08384 [Venustampulla echinocandica]RDL32945.1 Uncharacterized protein BP5553_08384 [Venustampulla echinocandica]